jgi:ABC-type antimicrobial peptide transport system permease subunit
MFLEELGKDYVRTARAKGLSEGAVMRRHVLRNALIPIITSAGSYLPYVFLGSLVFESFFGLPGLGAYVIEAIARAGSTLAGVHAWANRAGTMALSVAIPAGSLGVMVAPGAPGAVRRRRPTIPPEPRG